MYFSSLCPSKGILNRYFSTEYRQIARKQLRPGVADAFDKYYFLIVLFCVLSLTYFDIYPILVLNSKKGGFFMYCENCGVSVPDGSTVCDICGQPVAPFPGETPITPPTPDYTSSYSVEQETPVYAQPSIPQKREHPFLGTIGAILGAILGGASIILFSQMGYVAAISGVILAFCTIKGYELLGRRLTNRGAIISIILILITPYLADRLDWAIMLCEAIGEINGPMLLAAFISVPDLLAEGYIEQSTYIQSLVMVYIFAALGAVGSLKDLFSK